MSSLDQIDLRLLRIFDAMHANRHVTRAAEELGGVDTYRIHKMMAAIVTTAR
jgi:hypothetical protein